MAPYSSLRLTWFFILLFNQTGLTSSIFHDAFVAYSPPFPYNVTFTLGAHAYWYGVCYKQNFVF